MTFGKVVDTSLTVAEIMKACEVGRAEQIDGVIKGFHPFQDDAH